MSGISRITEERQRHLDGEGWTLEGDIENHPNGELALAAICYASEATGHLVEILGRDLRPGGKPGDYHVDPWPWDKSWDKRSKHSTMKCLVIAGSLIAAEIDRREALGEEEEEEEEK